MSAIDDLLKKAAERGINTGYEQQANEFANIMKVYFNSLQKVGFSRKEAIQILTVMIPASKRGD